MVALRLLTELVASFPVVFVGLLWLSTVVEVVWFQETPLATGKGKGHLRHPTDLRDYTVFHHHSGVGVHLIRISVALSLDQSIAGESQIHYDQRDLLVPLADPRIQSDCDRSSIPYADGAVQEEEIVNVCVHRTCHAIGICS